MRRQRSGELPRVVWLLGWASFANDVSSEAIFPLLPLYLVALGGGVQLLGLIEGSADALASAVKVLAGRWSDRGPRRLLVVGGYGLPALARAGIAAALAPWHVLAARLTDRVGKGIRSGPRDALLADAVPEAAAGRAFGVQRSLDHLGAAVGPLVASGLLFALAGLPQERALRVTFAIAAALGLVAPALVLLGVEPTATSTSNTTANANANANSASNATAMGRRLPGAFWKYLGCAAIFALANSALRVLCALPRPHRGRGARARGRRGRARRAWPRLRLVPRGHGRGGAPGERAHGLAVERARLRRRAGHLGGAGAPGGGAAHGGCMAHAPPGGRMSAAGAARGSVDPSPFGSLIHPGRAGKPRATRNGKVSRAASQARRQ